MPDSFAQPAIHPFNDLARLLQSSEAVRGFLSFPIEALRPLPFFAYGQGGGPVAVILGGQHGDEPAGVAVVAELGRRLEALPALPNIRIVGLPMANRLAFAERRRVWSGDGQDLNRLFDPPEPKQGLTAELARSLLACFESVPLRLLIDVHSGGEHELLTHIRTHEEGGSDFWRAVGAHWAQRFHLPRGFLIRALSDRGIPAFTLEIGGAGLAADEVNRGAAGLCSVLASQGWIDAPVFQGQLRTVITVHRETAPGLGIFRRTLPLGCPVSPGLEVGVMTDLGSGGEAVLRAERHAYLSGAATFGLVRPGMCLYELVMDADPAVQAAVWVDGKAD